MFGEGEGSDVSSLWIKSVGEMLYFKFTKEMDEVRVDMTIFKVYSREKRRDR